MKCIEIIEIRSNPHSKEWLEEQLKKIRSEINEHRKKPSIEIFSRVNLDTDYVLLLQHDSHDARGGGSSLGLQLASALKEFGMVNHNLWEELK